MEESTPGDSAVDEAPLPPLPAPLLFVGELQPWLDYRANLVARCQAWQANSFAGRALLETGEAARLFPPPALSMPLAAGSRWRPAEGKPSLVVVTVGGIYGGFDGPAGLFDYISAVLSRDVAFLQLDTGHDPEVALAVLRAGLRWLLSAHPEAAGRIVLAGFSMGSATAVEAGAWAAEAVRGLLIVAGQTAGTQRLASFAGRPVLVVHGQWDPNVSPACARQLAASASAAGAAVQLEVLQQAPPDPEAEGSFLERLRRHHLWDERWDVQAIALAWLRSLMRNDLPHGGPAARQLP